MKNILLKLFVLSYTPVLSFALEPMIVVPEAKASTRDAIQNIRLQGLQRLENTGFHFGSKEFLKKAPDLKKILHGLKVGKGIFSLHPTAGILFSIVTRTAVSMDQWMFGTPPAFSAYGLI